MTYRSSAIKRGPSLEDMSAALFEGKEITFYSFPENFGVDWESMICKVDRVEKGDTFELLDTHWRIEGSIVKINGLYSKGAPEWDEHWRGFVRYQAKYCVEDGRGILQFVTRESMTEKRPTGFSNEERKRE